MQTVQLAGSPLRQFGFFSPSNSRIEKDRTGGKESFVSSSEVDVSRLKFGGS